MLMNQFDIEREGEIIAQAWRDDVSFEFIKKVYQLDEKSVIQLMRCTLKPSSFRLWRKRVSGRKFKHQKLCKIKDKLAEDPEG